MGKGKNTCPHPWKYCKVLFVRQMFQVSVDKMFMHYSEKMLSDSGGFAPAGPPWFCPWTPLGDYRTSDPANCQPLEKILRSP